MKYLNLWIFLSISALLLHMSCVPANFTTKTVIDIEPPTPTGSPTASPTSSPPSSPSPTQSGSPTMTPNQTPSPSLSPQQSPSPVSPTLPPSSPTSSPSVSPSTSPISSPSQSPSVSPVSSPSPTVGPSATTSASPTSSPSQSPTQPPLRDVVFKYTIIPADNQVDILLVVDDSNSMLSDNLKLADRMSSFVNSLMSSGLNWQMCVTTTRTSFYDGKSIYWYPNAAVEQYISTKEVLLPSTPNIPTVFRETINRIGAGWSNSDDERGVLAMFRHLERRSGSSCYRQDAGLAVIVISDEDERSVGGNPYLEYYQNEYKPFEYGDYPDNYLQLVRSQFGFRKRIAVNSIIVRPEDQSCMKAQDLSGPKSHYGRTYEELSLKTRGYVGNICDSDYSSNIQFFKNQTQNVLSRVTLECVPYGPIRVEITPALPSTVQTRLVDQTLVFDPVIPENHTVSVFYKCTQ